MLDRGLLPGLDRDRIMGAYAAAPGREADSGKFLSPESSAALVANFFGFFLDRPSDLPGLPGMESLGTARSVAIERCLRFPWTGGLHPWLDAVVETDTHLVAIESKRYEPFRPKRAAMLSPAYWRPVWGDGMRGFKRVRDSLAAGELVFRHLDAVQLVKHALGLRTQAALLRKKPVLVYLHAAPERWPDGRVIAAAARQAHSGEIRQFADVVAGDEVAFRAVSWRDLLVRCGISDLPACRTHAGAVAAAFAPL